MIILAAYVGNGCESRKSDKGDMIVSYIEVVDSISGGVGKEVVDAEEPGGPGSIVTGIAAKSDANDRVFDCDEVGAETERGTGRLLPSVEMCLHRGQVEGNIVAVALYIAVLEVRKRDGPATTARAATALITLISKRLKGK